MRDWLIIALLVALLCLLGGAAFANPVITTKTEVDVSMIELLLTTFDEHRATVQLLLIFAFCVLLVIQVRKAISDWAHKRKNGNGHKYISREEFLEAQRQNHDDHESLGRRIELLNKSVQDVGKKADSIFKLLRKRDEENK